MIRARTNLRYTIVYVSCACYTTLKMTFVMTAFTALMAIVELNSKYDN